MSSGQGPPVKRWEPGWGTPILAILQKAYVFSLSKIQKRPFWGYVNEGCHKCQWTGPPPHGVKRWGGDPHFASTGAPPMRLRGPPLCVYGGPPYASTGAPPIVFVFFVAFFLAGQAL